MFSFLSWYQTIRVKTKSFIFLLLIFFFHFYFSFFSMFSFLLTKYRLSVCLVGRRENRKEGVIDHLGERKMDGMRDSLSCYLVWNPFNNLSKREEIKMEVFVRVWSPSSNLFLPPFSPTKQLWMSIFYY